MNENILYISIITAVLLISAFALIKVINDKEVKARYDTLRKNKFMDVCNKINMTSDNIENVSYCIDNNSVAYPVRIDCEKISIWETNCTPVILNGG